MRTPILTIAALVCAGALSAYAQQPPEQQPPQKPPTGDTTQRTMSPPEQTVTVTGCLKAEKDVPGLTPNPAERAGVTEDYILTAVKLAPTSKVSGLALASMYEVEGIAEAELKRHLNHVVELTGRIASAPTADDRTPNFTATTLKMVSATCPMP
jgi:hypothetical protein